MENEWGPCLQTLQGHGRSAVVTAIAFSPDRAVFASSSSVNKSGEGGSIKLWDAVTGQCRQILKGYGSSINCIAFSPDGTVLASGRDCDSSEEESGVDIWDVSTGQCLQTLKSHIDIGSIAFSPNGTILASGTGGVCYRFNDCTDIKLWDVAAWQCRRVMECCRDPIHSIAFSPDGTLLASGSSGSFGTKGVKIWEVATGQCLQILDGYSDPVSGIAFSPDGTVLASNAHSSDIEHIKLWDVATGHCLRTLDNDRGGRIILSPNGAVLVSAHVFDGLSSSNRRFSASAFSPDGTVFASGHFGGTIRLWDTAAVQYDWIFASGSPITFLTSDTAFALRSSSGDHYNLASTSHSSGIFSIVFSPDGTTLASSCADCVKFWDVATGRCRLTLSTGSMSAIAFSPDGTLLASHGLGDEGPGSVKLWDVATGQCYRTLIIDDHIRAIAFSPHGAILASVSCKKNGIYAWRTNLWDVADGSYRHICEERELVVHSVAFSPNSNILALSSHFDKSMKVELWDVATNHCLQRFDNCGGAVAFSPDGTMLATSMAFSGIVVHDVKLWDVAKGQCVQAFNIGRYIFDLSFDSSGAHLHTNFGTFPLDAPTSSEASLATSTPLSEQPRYLGYGISSDGAWITWNSENVLWLPPQHRPCFRGSVVKGSAVAIGCQSGRVLIFRFRTKPSFPQ